MRIIAVYGGAFNPIHCGHAMVASWIHLTGLADRVWFVPSAAHPFGKEMASFEQRIEMCREVAMELGTWALVSPVESSLPAPNYTINLLQHLQSRHPSDRFRFVMGSDNLALRSKWHGFEDILKNFNPIFVQRAGEGGRNNLASQSPVFPDISSTEIRRRVKAGEPVSHLVPACILPSIKHL